MKKRVVAVLLMAAMTLSMLAGCSGGKEEEGTSSKDSSKEVEIQFMHSQPEEERVQAIQGIIDDFMKENEGITVTQMPIPEDGYWTKITTLMSTGELPAIVESGVDALRLINTEEALDLKANTEAIELAGKDRYYDGVLKMLGAPGVDD